MQMKIYYFHQLATDNSIGIIAKRYSASLEIIEENFDSDFIDTLVYIGELDF